MPVKKGQNRIGLGGSACIESEQGRTDWLKRKKGATIRGCLMGPDKQRNG
jgi:hypothetical protein